MDSLLDAPLSVLRLNPKWERALASTLDIRTLEDVLLHLPRTYNDRTRVTLYARITNDEQPVQLVATLKYLTHEGEGTKQRLVAEFEDESGTFQAYDHCRF